MSKSDNTLNVLVIHTHEDFKRVIEVCINAVYLCVWKQCHDKMNGSHNRNSSQNMFIINDMYCVHFIWSQGTWSYVKPFEGYVCLRSQGISFCEWIHEPLKTFFKRVKDTSSVMFSIMPLTQLSHFKHLLLVFKYNRELLIPECMELCRKLLIKSNIKLSIGARVSKSYLIPVYTRFCGELVNVLLAECVMK